MKKFKMVGAVTKDALETMWHNKFFSVVLIAVACLSFLTVPYNWDSMTYHLARIVHWVQNQSVEHYGTTIYRQVASPPLHEFVCLHVFLLSGKKDLYLNLIQYAAFLTNGWVVCGIAEKLGCKRRFCKVGLLLLYSMPIAFGEALTTQNDHFSGMWLLIFTYYLLDFLHKEKKIEYSRTNILKCSVMGACVGYGYITKPSVCIGMLFMVVVLLFCCIMRKDSPGIIARLICVVLPVMLLLIVPEMARNIVTFGSILPNVTGARQLVGTWKPNYLLVNGMKNLAFNFPSIFVPRSGRLIETVVRRVALLLNVYIDDPAISEDGRAYFLGGADDYGHDTAVSSVIVITALLCFLWCVYRRKKQESSQRQYTYIVVALFVVFCIIVRWEPFVSRYMLPYLMLLCPMVSIQLQDISEHTKWEMWRISCVPAVSCLCIVQLFALFSYHAQITKTQGMDRPEGYFYNRSNIMEEYREACEYIIREEYREVGLMMGSDSYEYPIWYMLQGRVDRIDSLGVSEETCRYEDMTYVPDCIFAAGNFGESLIVHDRVYIKTLEGNEASVYVLDDR